MRNVMISADVDLSRKQCVVLVQSFLWTISDQCLEHHFEQASQTRTDIIC